MPDTKKNRIFSTFLFVLYLAFFVSLIFSLRAISSISIGLILITGFLKNRIEQKSFFNPQLKNLFLIFCSLFFILQLLSLFYTTDKIEGWKHIRLKSALVIVPFCLYCCHFLNDKIREKLLKWYCAVLFAASVFTLYKAVINYTASHDLSEFFYHKLVSPFSQHAVQFSIFIFIALIFLLEKLRKNEIYWQKAFHLFLTGFFTVYLILLASKLFIAFFVLYIIYFLVRIIKAKTVNRSIITMGIAGFIIALGIALFTSNPVSERFNDIVEGDIHFIERDKFNPGDYFNGLQFRLLQWRFVTEILTEKKAWLIGVSPGDAQHYLDEKYISQNMYLGHPETGDHGFLGYNTHSELLEALLQNGIIGLLLFLFICFSLFRMAWQKKNHELSFITVLVLAFSLTESVFETQYSLLLFCFFPLFFYLGKEK